MRKYAVFLIVATMGWFLTGCGSTDLALLNEVKRFEPEWMDLSEKVTDLSRLIRKTDNAYESFRIFASPRLGDADANERNGLDNPMARYRNLIKERDELAEDFSEKRERFEKAVQDFNQWQNALMRDELDEEEANKTFETFRETHATLEAEITQVEAKVTKNVEASNTMVRTVCRAIGSLREDEYIVDLSY
jgi:chromosome segregation ATPase